MRPNLTQLTPIRDNLQIIGAKLNNFSQQYSSASIDVQLLAVSKRHPAASIKEAYDTGQRTFGENYVQELTEKAQQLKDLDIEWHFIGPLQSNKTKDIAKIASWVHTIDRLKIAQRLNDQRPDNLPPLSICIQVNISNEASKSGVPVNQVATLAAEIVKLPHLSLRGLMVIPAPERDFAKQRKTFSKVFALKEQLNQQGYQLDTLSMGMSGDMEAAIAEGASIIRIGTAIFGRRKN